VHSSSSVGGPIVPAIIVLALVEAGKTARSAPVMRIRSRRFSTVSVSEIALGRYPCFTRTSFFVDRRAAPHYFQGDCFVSHEPLRYMGRRPNARVRRILERKKAWALPRLSFFFFSALVQTALYNASYNQRATVSIFFLRQGVFSLFAGVTFSQPRNPNRLVVNVFSAPHQRAPLPRARPFVFLPSFSCLKSCQ